MTTGPHSILWDVAAGELAPPYTLRATLTKREGRLHEGRFRPADFAADDESRTPAR